jgi:hypothetical protein
MKRHFYHHDTKNTKEIKSKSAGFLGNLGVLAMDEKLVA